MITNAALALGLSRYRSDRLAPADWVTLARATLAVGVAALIADSFERPAPVALLVSLAAVALALDAVDGWVARRTRTEGLLGARFDAEVDAFLILILSVYVARSAGAWVLAIGAARYVVPGGRVVLPWMRAQLPPRYWRKVVAATQGIVLTVAAADVLPRGCDRRPRSSPRSSCSPSRSAATCWWLWTRRQPPHGPPPAAADSTLDHGGAPSRRPRTRTRAHGHRRGAHDPRLRVRVGRPRRSGPADSSHARARS